jgi:hypothetical protein
VANDALTPEGQTVVTNKCVTLPDKKSTITQERVFLQKFLGQFTTSNTLSMEPLF